MADISQIKLPNNNTYDLKDTVARGVKMYYGICTTAAATAAKVVTVGADQDFKLTVGALVMVKFTINNSASSVTLNVNNTGAKSIYYGNGVYTGTSTTVCGYANAHHIYMYDGTNWVWVGHGSDSNTTYSAMSVSEGNTGTATSSRVMRADYLKQIIQHHAVPAGQGVPAGGTAGQVLAKVDGTNYNTEWITPSGGGDLPEWEEVAVSATVTEPTEDVCWRITGGRTPSASMKEIIPFLKTQGRSDTLDNHGVVYFIRKYYAENSYIDRVIFIPVDTTQKSMCVIRDSVDGKWRVISPVHMWDVATTYTAPSANGLVNMGSSATVTYNYDDNCYYWVYYIIQIGGECNDVTARLTITPSVTTEPTLTEAITHLYLKPRPRSTVSSLEFDIYSPQLVVANQFSGTTHHMMFVRFAVITSGTSPTFTVSGDFRI